LVLKFYFVLLGPLAFVVSLWTLVMAVTHVEDTCISASFLYQKHSKHSRTVKPNSFGHVYHQYKSLERVSPI